MRVGRRTARLIREAAVMGFVQGSMYGESRMRNEPFPKDRDILYRVLRGARWHGDLYPTLSKVVGSDYEIALAAPRKTRTPESHDDAGSPGPLPAESADQPTGTA